MIRRGYLPSILLVLSQHMLQCAVCWTSYPDQYRQLTLNDDLELSKTFALDFGPDGMGICWARNLFCDALGSHLHVDQQNTTTPPKRTPFASLLHRRGFSCSLNACQLILPHHYRICALSRCKKGCQHLVTHGTPIGKNASLSLIANNFVRL